MVQLFLNMNAFTIVKVYDPYRLASSQIINIKNGCCCEAAEKVLICSNIINPKVKVDRFYKLVDFYFTFPSYFSS
ncbi:MAG: hypothetical protein LBV19_02890, partial [Streptococcaceae bacterium]|nr:hypothetical protein [Streptococcaceae bacterium]